MARNSLPEGQKRKQIAVRLGPEDRERVQKFADEHGASLGSEVERLALERLDYLESRDEPTRALLSAIADEIDAIQRRTGKRWHKDLATWAAVGEMLRAGPIQELDPDNPRDDEAVQDAWSDVFHSEEEKKVLADRLNEMGIPVRPENPNKTPVRRGGLFGNFTPTPPRRAREKVFIEMMEDGKDKEEALRLFERIMELDEVEAEADQRHTDSLKVFWDAKAEGRDTYRTMLKERAAQNHAAGLDYSMAHLLGYFD